MHGVPQEWPALQHSVPCTGQGCRYACCNASLDTKRIGIYKYIYEYIFAFFKDVIQQSAYTNSCRIS